MAQSGKSGRDRIQKEPSESVVGDALAAKIGEQALPGVFSGGKQIMRTHQEPGLIVFYFNDQTTMEVQGDFVVSFNQAPKGLSETTGDVIEGEVTDEEDVTERTGWDRALREGGSGQA